MQTQTVSKSEFKAKALQYLRMVEQSKQQLLISHNGKPVVQINPYVKEDEDTILKKLGNSITYVGNITDPVGVDDWEALK